MKNTLGLFIFIAVFAGIKAEAAKIITIKSGKALVDLEGESYSTGQLLLARDANGKRRAILQVSQVKGGRAIAVVRKGQAQASFSLEKLERGASGSRGGSNKSKMGLLAGYASNSMTAKPASGSRTLTGSSFNLVGFYQMPLDKKINVKLLAGYESLSVKDDTYNVDLGYLGFTAQVEYKFYQGSTWDFWAGGGLGFLYAMSKSSNILDTSKISINQTVIGALGANYRLDNRTFIPIQFSYSIFPDNSSSSASQMIIRAGWGRDF